MSETMDAAPWPPTSSQSLMVATSDNALQKRKITTLEERLQELESGQVVKQRELNYFMSKGRGIRCIVALFDNIEELIAKNDRSKYGQVNGAKQTPIEDSETSYERISTLFNRTNRDEYHGPKLRQMLKAWALEGMNAHGTGLGTNEGDDGCSEWDVDLD
ncbi:hypothetical protein EV702DRAFT_1199235 [Suillus placidus]|uniref:Uncharacterized protein n=1 Tax=Suillus placidus TaxID=48579 RepID=A0A9P7D1E6_9AGAM|nr:hypothetical protein EV702DRAFT_1199235 [Suillus placidus]